MTITKTIAVLKKSGKQSMKTTKRKLPGRLDQTVPQPVTLQNSWILFMQRSQVRISKVSLTIRFLILDTCQTSRWQSDRKSNKYFHYFFFLMDISFEIFRISIYSIYYTKCTKKIAHSGLNIIFLSPGRLSGRNDVTSGKVNLFIYLFILYLKLTCI